MHTRKLQMSGYSTYVVSLPKEWLKKNNLKKGDVVQLHLQPDFTIMVSPSSILRKGQEAVVSVQDIDYIKTTIIALYLDGNHIIRINIPKNKREQYYSEITDTLNKIKGQEIVEDTGTEIIIQDFFNMEMLGPNKAIRRMHFIVHNRLSCIHQVFNKGSRQDSCRLLDSSADWLNWLINRQYCLVLNDISLSDKLNMTPQKGMQYVFVAGSLENITIHSEKILNSLDNLNDRLEVIDNIIAKDLKVLLELLETAIMAFSKSDFDEANFVLEKVIYLQDDLNRVTELMLSDSEIGTDIIISYSFIIDSLSRICSYTTDIAEAAIDCHYLNEG